MEAGWVRGTRNAGGRVSQEAGIASSSMRGLELLAVQSSCHCIALLSSWEASDGAPLLPLVIGVFYRLYSRHFMYVVSYNSVRLVLKLPFYRGEN